MTRDLPESSLMLLKRQRSHVLLVLSQHEVGQAETFLAWYGGACLQAVLACPEVLGGKHYRRHEVDITCGAHAPLPLEYLALYELSLDGADQAGGLIEHIVALHREQGSAQAPATWLYYPVSEKVGRPPTAMLSMLTLAFANPVEGREAEFREWYATRHIRHAMNIPALVSGQCLARTQFQKPGCMPAIFHTVAIYEQEGAPESIIESFDSLPPGALDFPAMDLARGRFAEAVYRPV